MIALLRSPVAGVQESAAGVLWNLTVNNGALPCACAAAVRHVPRLTVTSAAENRIAIARAGGILPLIDLLRSPVAGVQEAAAGALWNLSFNNGALPCACAAAVRHVPRLTVTSAAENRIAIARAGGILPLIDLLRSPVAGVQEAAARALWNLAANNGALPCAAPRVCRRGPA